MRNQKLKFLDYGFFLKNSIPAPPPTTNPPGTYSFSVGNVSGYTSSSVSGTIIVSGNLQLTVTYTAIPSTSAATITTVIASGGSAGGGFAAGAGVLLLLRRRKL